jgi:hypothetical protein
MPANKWLVTCVHPDVVFEILRFVKLLGWLADGAREHCVNPIRLAVVNLPARVLTDHSQLAVLFSNSVGGNGCCSNICILALLHLI